MSFFFPFSIVRYIKSFRDKYFLVFSLFLRLACIYSLLLSLYLSFCITPHTYFNPNTTIFTFPTLFLHYGLYVTPRVTLSTSTHHRRPVSPQHHYRNAMFWADKVVSLSGGAAADVYWLAQTYYLTKQYHRAIVLLTTHKLLRVMLNTLSLSLSFCLGYVYFMFVSVFVCMYYVYLFMYFVLYSVD